MALLAALVRHGRRGGPEGLASPLVAAGARSQREQVDLAVEVVVAGRAEQVVAALPADHHLARHDRIALSELAGEPFVFFPRHRSVLAYDQFIASCRAAGFSPAIVQEAGGISTLGLVAAGLGVTVVAASYQALSLTGVRLVPVVGHQLTLQVAWAADNTNTALPGFLDTARHIAAQTTPQRESGPLAGP